MTEEQLYKNQSVKLLSWGKFARTFHDYGHFWPAKFENFAIECGAQLSADYPRGYPNLQFSVQLIEDETRHIYLKLDSVVEAKIEYNMQPFQTRYIIQTGVVVKLSFVD